MKIIRSIPDLRRQIDGFRRMKRPIGFVPTMGALHSGHVSLMSHARKSVGANGVVVVSVFVNPTQFNQKSDLARYPRNLSLDAKICDQAGVDLLFAPSAKSIYPSNFSTWVNETALSLPLCGAKRPGHFQGVCTVVLKLLNLVQPTLAIFGQKDAQQALVIQRMVRDLNVPVQIKVAPIIRESDGLAMSSRNQRLSPTDRQRALILSKTLQQVRRQFKKGARKTAILKSYAKKQLRRTPGLRLDYLEIMNPDLLQPVVQASKGDLLAVAAFVGKVRLIDNIRL